MHVLQWLSKSHGLNPAEALWEDLKLVHHKGSKQASLS